MSQALNNLKKLIIEMVEEEVSTNEYGNTQAKKKKQKGLEEKLNLFLEKNKPTNPSKWSYYKSQAKKNYFSPDFIRSLAKTRGIQFGTTYAECFEVIRWRIK